MSKKGVFAVDREFFDHPVFAPEPYTEREAWLWLIKEAAWKPLTIRVRNGTMDLKRGQLAHATRYLAVRWKWSEAKVRRFLNRLKTASMIPTQPDARATLITICNYDTYQRIGLPCDAQTTRTRRKEETLKNIETKARGRARIFVEKGTKEWTAWQAVKPQPPMRADDGRQGWWYPSLLPELDKVEGEA